MNMYACSYAGTSVVLVLQNHSSFSTYFKSSFSFDSPVCRSCFVIQSPSTLSVQEFLVIIMFSTQ